MNIQIKRVEILVNYSFIQTLNHIHGCQLQSIWDGDVTDVGKGEFG